MKMKYIQKQLGQAFPVGIALFFILGVTSFVLFNTGQTVTDKTRVVNTADSAAYSGLLWQARAMNFTAYTNRAMVANEVAMAQAVSLNSWSGYLALTGSNLDRVLGSVPYIGVVTGIVNAIASAIDTFLTPISEGMLAVINSINAGISIAQESMYLATFAATPDVVNSVVKSNDIRGQNFEWDSGFSLINTGLNLKGWHDLTARYDDDDKEEMLERGQMVNESMDKFSKERNWRFFDFFIPITPINWIRLEKHGTTKHFGTPDGSKWEWQANDALSIREKRYTWRGKKYSDIPIAGASSMANNDDSWDSILGHEHRFHGRRHKIAKKRKRKTPYLATHDGRQMDGYTGLHAYRALTTEWRRKDEPPILKLRIEITVDPDNINSAKDLNGENEFTEDIDTPGNVITSVSAAELFFERPCLNESCGDTEEYADSYSPYWDVRLAENSGVTRLAAYALHGDTLTDNSHFTPSKINSLAKFQSGIATPLTDYKEQYKGIKRSVQSLRAQLTALAEGSEQFRRYKERLEAIEANFNLEVDNIIEDFVFEGYNEDDLSEALAKAAGFDFDMQEFEEIKGAVGDVYEGMNDIASMDDLKDQFGEIVDNAGATLEQNIRDALEDELRDAITNIMAGLITNTISNYTGVDIDTDLVEEIVSNEVESVLDTQVAPTHSTDIAVDLRDECSIYNAVHSAELEIEDMQIRLEEVNQKIANDFHERLLEETAEAVQELEKIDAEIVRLQGLYNSYPSTRTLNGVHYNDAGNFRDAVTSALRAQRDKRPLVYSKRFDDLVYALMEISDGYTSTLPEFANFRLEYRFAKKAVEDTIGDIRDLEIDENGETVSENLFYAEAENELASDTEQSFTEKPENC